MANQWIRVNPNDNDFTKRMKYLSSTGQVSTGQVSTGQSSSGDESSFTPNREQQAFQDYRTVKTNEINSGLDLSTASGMEAYIWNNYSGKERDDAYATLDAAYSTKGSKFYDPYRNQATNQSYLDDLKSMGVEVPEVVTSDWLTQMAQKYQPYYNINKDSGNPNSPGTKKSVTNDQKIAYDIFKLWGDEDTTEKAENEWADMKAKVTYWAQKGLSDKEIKDKIDMKKYPTLSKMDESRKIGNIVTMNRAIGYSGDALDGVIWKARNGYGDDMDDFQAAVRSKLGQGRGDRSTAKQIAQRTVGTSEYNPYVGGSNDDDARMTMGIKSWDNEWLKAHQQDMFAAGQKDLWRQMDKEQGNYEAAKKQYDILQNWVASYPYDIKAATKEEAIAQMSAALDDRLSNASKLYGDEDGAGKLDALISMDEGRRTGKPVGLSNELNYRKEDILAEMVQRYNSTPARQVTEQPAASGENADAYLGQRTNKPIYDELASLGVQIPENASTEWLNQMSAQYQGALKIDPKSGNPKEPNAKTATPEELIAYDIYQLQRDEETTQKAEAEWADYQKKVTYWAQRGLSDDEIRAKIDMKDYPTLAKMDESRTVGNVVTMNRTVDYTPDAVDGLIWKARNNEPGVDNLTAAEYAKKGYGKGDSASESDIARRNPASPDYHPYLGGSNDDEARMTFGLDHWTRKSLDNKKEEAFKNEDTKKIWQRMDQELQNFDEAKKEYDILQKWVDTYKYNFEGKTPEEAVQRMTEDLEDRLSNESGLYDDFIDGAGKLTMLNKLDEGRRLGKPVGLSDELDYRKEDILREMISRYEEATGNKVSEATAAVEAPAAGGAPGWDQVAAANGMDLPSLTEYANGMLSPGSKVDLGNRPVLDSQALIDAGWDEEPGQRVTLYSMTEGLGDEQHQMNALLTPVLASGEVLTPEQFDDYIDELNQYTTPEEVLAHDRLGIVMVCEAGNWDDYQAVDQIGQVVHNLSDGIEDLKINGGTYNSASAAEEYGVSEEPTVPQFPEYNPREDPNVQPLPLASPGNLEDNVVPMPQTTNEGELKDNIENYPNRQTNTPAATNTPAPTGTPKNTPSPTNTPAPTGTPKTTPSPANTPAPTATAAPTEAPTSTPAPEEQDVPQEGQSWGDMISGWFNDAIDAAAAAFDGAINLQEANLFTGPELIKAEDFQSAHPSNSTFNNKRCIPVYSEEDIGEGSAVKEQYFLDTLTGKKYSRSAVQSALTNMFMGLHTDKDEKAAINMLNDAIPWAFESGSKTTSFISNAFTFGNQGEKVFDVIRASESGIATAKEQADIALALFDDAVAASAQGMTIGQYYNQNPEAYEDVEGIMNGIYARRDKQIQEDAEKDAADKEARLLEAQSIVSKIGSNEALDAIDQAFLQTIMPTGDKQEVKDYLYKDPTNAAYLKSINYDDTLWSMCLQWREQMINDNFNVSPALLDSEMDGIVNLVEQGMVLDAKLAQSAGMTLEEYYQTSRSELNLESRWKNAVDAWNSREAPENLTTEQKEGIGLLGVIASGAKTGAADYAQGYVGFLRDANEIGGADTYQGVKYNWLQAMGGNDLATSMANVMYGRETYRDALYAEAKKLEASDPARAQAIVSRIEEALANGEDIFNVAIDVPMEQLAADYRALQKVKDVEAEYLATHATDGETRAAGWISSGVSSTMKSVTNAAMLMAGIPKYLAGALAFGTGSFHSTYQETGDVVWSAIDAGLETFSESEWASRFYNFGGNAAQSWLSKAQKDALAAIGPAGQAGNLARRAAAYLIGGLASEAGEISQELAQNGLGDIADCLYHQRPAQWLLDKFNIISNPEARREFIDTIMSTAISTAGSYNFQQVTGRNQEGADAGTAFSNYDLIQHNLELGRMFEQELANRKAQQAAEQPAPIGLPDMIQNDDGSIDPTVLNASAAEQNQEVPQAQVPVEQPATEQPATPAAEQPTARQPETPKTEQSDPKQNTDQLIKIRRWCEDVVFELERLRSYRATIEKIADGGIDDLEPSEYDNVRYGLKSIASSIDIAHMLQYGQGFNPRISEDTTKNYSLITDRLNPANSFFEYYLEPATESNPNPWRNFMQFYGRLETELQGELGALATQASRLMQENDLKTALSMMYNSPDILNEMKKSLAKDFTDSMIRAGYLAMDANVAAKEDATANAKDNLDAAQQDTQVAQAALDSANQNHESVSANRLQEGWSPKQEIDALRGVQTAKDKLEDAQKKEADAQKTYDDAKAESDAALDSRVAAINAHANDLAAQAVEAEAQQFNENAAFDDTSSVPEMKSIPETNPVYTPEEQKEAKAEATRASEMTPDELNAEADQDIADVTPPESQTTSNETRTTFADRLKAEVVNEKGKPLLTAAQMKAIDTALTRSEKLNEFFNGLSTEDLVRFVNDFKGRTAKSRTLGFMENWMRDETQNKAAADAGIDKQDSLKKLKAEIRKAVKTKDRSLYDKAMEKYVEGHEDLFDIVEDVDSISIDGETIYFKGAFGKPDTTSFEDADTPSTGADQDLESLAYQNQEEPAETQEQPAAGQVQVTDVFGDPANGTLTDPNAPHVQEAPATQEQPAPEKPDTRAADKERLLKLTATLSGIRGGVNDAVMNDSQVDEAVNAYLDADAQFKNAEKGSPEAESLAATRKNARETLERRMKEVTYSNARKNADRSAEAVASAKELSKGLPERIRAQVEFMSSSKENRRTGLSGASAKKRLADVKTVVDTALSILENDLGPKAYAKRASTLAWAADAFEAVDNLYSAYSGTQPESGIKTRIDNLTEAVRAVSEAKKGLANGTITQAQYKDAVAKQNRAYNDVMDTVQDLDFKVQELAGKYPLQPLRESVPSETIYGKQKEGDYPDDTPITGNEPEFNVVPPESEFDEMDGFAEFEEKFNRERAEGDMAVGEYTGDNQAPPTPGDLSKPDAEPGPGQGKRQFANETAQGSWLPEWAQSELRSNPELANYDTDSNRAQMARATQTIMQNGPETVLDHLVEKFNNGKGTFDKDDTAQAIALALYAAHEGDNELLLTVTGMYDIMGTTGAQAMQLRSIWNKFTPAGAQMNTARQAQNWNDEAKRSNPRKYKAAQNAASEVNRSLGNLPSGDKTDSNNRWNAPLNAKQMALIKHYGLENVNRPGINYNRATKKQRMLEAILATPNVEAPSNNGLSLADRLEMINRNIPVITNADLNYIGAQMSIFMGQGGMGGDRAGHVAAARAFEASSNIKPAGFGDKLRTYRYTNMLNTVPTTLRNIMGNVTQNAVNNTSHGVAVGLDKAVSLITGKRSVGSLTMEQRVNGWKSFMNELANTYTDYAIDRAVTPQVEASQVAGEQLDPANRFNTNARKRTYQNGVLETRTTLENLLMSIGDRPVWAKHFRNSLDEQMNVGGNNVATKEQIEQAIADANYSTFTEDNRLADAIQALKQKLGPYGGIVDWVMPFTGVPSNIMKRMYQYSPLSLVTTGIKHGIAAQKGTFNQRSFVTEAARGLTGTGMAALGFMLGRLGMIKFGTSDEDDDKKRGLRTALGEQYSMYIYNPFTKRYVSLSTFLPSVSSVLLGTVIEDITKEDKDIGNILLGALTAEIDSIIDASYLSGLQNVMTSYRQGGAGEAAVAMVSSGLSSFTPSSVSQIANAIDPYVRDTNDKSSIMKALNAGVINRIPYLRQMLLPEKVDVTGKAVENYKKGLENLFNPLTVSPAKEDDAINELLRLSEVTGDTTFLPGDPLSGKRNTLSGVARPLTNKEKEWNKKLRGTLVFEGGDTKDKNGDPVHIIGLRQLFASPAYASLSDEEKAKEVRAVVNAANTGAIREAKDAIGETEKGPKAEKSERESVGARPGMMDQLTLSPALDAAYQITLDGRLYAPTRGTTFTYENQEFPIDDEFNGYYVERMNQLLDKTDLSKFDVETELPKYIDGLYTKAYNYAKKMYYREHRQR